VVCEMAVHRPVPGRIGDKLNISCRAHRYQNGRFRPLRRFRNATSVGCRDLERIAVQVDRMVVHRAQIPKSHADPLTRADNQRIGSRESLAVHSQDVEIRHLARVGTPGANGDVPLAQHDGEVAIHWVFRVPLMDDNHAHEPHAHLRHLVDVGVVHERPRIEERELISEGFSGTDIGLAQTAHTVHAGGQDDAMPVDRGGLRQTVGDVDVHPITLHGFDGRARCPAIVAPAVAFQARSKLVLHRFGNEVEDLHPLYDPKGKRPAVRSHDRGLAGLLDLCGRSEVRGHVCLRLGSSWAAGQKPAADDP